MPTGELHHNTLGRVMVTVRQNSHHITARWKQGFVSLNVPQGVRLPELNRILDDLTPKLLAVRQEVDYHDGQRLHFPFIDIVIRSQRVAPERILAKASVPLSAIEVGKDWAFHCHRTNQAISEMLCKIARKVAAEVLIPHAREIAERIGRYPTGWTISTGHRILGQCSAKGIISLSYILLFLPDDLRDYVICHELAHLSEMNHSERFHKLLNEYLDGKEVTLVKKLHTYRWPVFR